MLSSLFLLAWFVCSAEAGAKNPKRGLAFASDVPGDVFNANQSASLISWQYNWNSIPPVYLATSDVPYVPMQWGSAAIDTFDDSVQVQGSKIILVGRPFAPESLDCMLCGFSHCSCRDSMSPTSSTKQTWTQPKLLSCGCNSFSR